MIQGIDNVDYLRNSIWTLQHTNRDLFNETRYISRVISRGLVNASHTPRNSAYNRIGFQERIEILFNNLSDYIRRVLKPQWGLDTRQIAYSYLNLICHKHFEGYPEINKAQEAICLIGQKEELIASSDLLAKIKLENS